MIFSTINRTQKRVSDSLVSSLFGLNTDDSPQKSALQIVLALNAHENSPFFNRINLYGNDYERNQSPPLSQATMVKSIINLICENLRESERDRFRKRKELKTRPAGTNKFLPFRKYYAENKDNSISNIIFLFFTSVRSAFLDSESKSYWDFNPESMKPNNVLQTTVGYFALLNILTNILEELSEEQKFDREVYEKYLIKAQNINFRDLQRYPLTTKSRSVLYLDMSLAIWPAANENDPRLIRLTKLLDE